MGLIPASAVALRLGRWEVRLSGPRGLVRAAGAVLSTVALPEENLPPLEVAISRARQARGTVAGAAWTLDLPPRGGVAALVGQIVGTATAILRRLLFVHAAAVSLNGRGYVVVGAPGSGKTSVAAILVREGAGYLSDEVALLDPADGTLHPFALPLAVKPWTARAIEHMPPVRLAASEGGIRYLLPDQRVRDPVPLEAVVMLREGRADQPAGVLPRAETLIALSQHPSSFRYRDRLEDAFTGFVRLVRAARCVQVTAPTPAAAAAAIRHLRGGLPPAPGGAT